MPLLGGRCDTPLKIPRNAPAAEFTNLYLIIKNISHFVGLGERTLVQNSPYFLNPQQCLK